jgi:glycosyltransferase involved in cell wall biosynthesis
MPELPPRTAIADAPLSMILLTSNSELFLDHLLDRWQSVLKAKIKDFEIVLVDDASTDGTLAQAELWKKKPKDLTVVSSLPPHGAGAAWRAGLAAAKPNPLLALAEFSPDYNPEDLGKLLEAINQVDLVTGIRPNRPSRWTWRGLLERWVFGVRLTDPTCAFKLFRRTVFDHLPLQSLGDFVHTEVVAKANFLGCLLAETPVEFHRTGSAAPDPLWKVDMRQVFRDPDFGPPPAKQDNLIDAAPALPTETATTAAVEDEIL